MVVPRKSKTSESLNSAKEKVTSNAMHNIQEGMKHAAYSFHTDTYSIIVPKLTKSLDGDNLWRDKVEYNKCIGYNNTATMT